MAVIVIIATDSNGRVVSVTERNLSTAEKKISDFSVPPSPAIAPSIGLPPSNVLFVQSYALAKIAESPLLTADEKATGAELVRKNLISGAPVFTDVQDVAVVVAPSSPMPQPLIVRLIDP